MARISPSLSIFSPFALPILLTTAAHAAVAAPAQGRYQLVSVNSGKCIDVTASGTDDGTNVQQYTCNGGLAQTWDLVQTATGEFKLLTALNGKAINIASASKNDGARLQIWADNGTVAQRYSVQPVSGSSTDWSIVNRSSGKCLDISGGATADGAALQQWSCNGNPQQRFRFVAKSIGATISPGRYTLKALHSGKCLDTASSGTANGTNLQQYTCNGGLAQAFDVSRDANGYYQFANILSNKVADVASAGIADGNNLQLWGVTNTDNQRFSLTEMGSGQYQVVAKHSGKCMDVAGEYTTDGANVQQWSCNGKTNQSWSFTVSNVATGSATAQIKQNMMNFFYAISGKQTLVGVENKRSSTPASDSARVAAIAGRPSSFWGGDFGFGSDAVNNRSVMIAEARNQFLKGAAVSLMYHACAPTRDEYCSWDDIGGARPAKLTNAQFQQLLTPGSALYNAWIGRLNTLAVYLQQLKDSGVVVMFRPLHEMNQCVFWWACHTGPYGSAALYRLTRDYLVKTKGLDNIIWVWNVQDFNSLATDVDAYTPGPDYFDIASLDIYINGYTDANYTTMQRISAGKPIAIAENQYVATAAQLAAQPKWIFQMLWPDFIDDPRNRAALPGLYSAGNVLTLDEMPGWR